MKTTIRTIALASLVAIASLSQTAIAQTGWPSTTVDIPFAFDSGTQHFEAGVYTFPSGCRTSFAFAGAIAQL